jgi:hypothetical protein
LKLSPRFNRESNRLRRKSRITNLAVQMTSRSYKHTKAHRQFTNPPLLSLFSTPENVELLLLCSQARDPIKAGDPFNNRDVQVAFPYLTNHKIPIRPVMLKMHRRVNQWRCVDLWILDFGVVFRTVHVCLPPRDDE